MIVIARFMSQVDAHLAKARLDDAGIPSLLDGENMVGLLGYAGGPGEVRLLVSPGQHDAALRALRSEDAEPAPPPDPADATGDAPPDPEAVALARGRSREKRRWRRFVAFYFALFIGLPFVVALAD